VNTTNKQNDGSSWFKMPASNVFITSNTTKGYTISKGTLDPYAETVNLLITPVNGVNTLSGNDLVYAVKNWLESDDGGKYTVGLQGTTSTLTGVTASKTVGDVTTSISISASNMSADKDNLTVTLDGNEVILAKAKDKYENLPLAKHAAYLFVYNESSYVASDDSSTSISDGATLTSGYIEVTRADAPTTGTAELADSANFNSSTTTLSGETSKKVYVKNGDTITIVLTVKASAEKATSTGVRAVISDSASTGVTFTPTYKDVITQGTTVTTSGTPENIEVTVDTTGVNKADTSITVTLDAIPNS
jgi:hypothetical protein